MSVTTQGNREGFWTDRKVAWYRRANERSDYAERVIELIREARMSICSNPQISLVLDGLRTVR